MFKWEKNWFQVQLPTFRFEEWWSSYFDILLQLCMSHCSVVLRITIPSSWMQFTQDNLARSQFERDASIRLRGLIDACLRQCANDMHSNGNTANAAFAARIQSQMEAKCKLQAHLHKVGVATSCTVRVLQTKCYRWVFKLYLTLYTFYSIADR